MNARELALRVGAPLAFAVIALGLWQLLASATGVPESTLPTPAQVAEALWDERSQLLDAAGTTVLEVVIGYALAIVVGAALATAASFSRVVEWGIWPWLVASQLVPVPAIAPLVVIWTGFDIRPKVIVIALVSFFPIAVNGIAGLRSTDRELLDLLRTLGAHRGRRFTIAQVPSALPYLFAGLRIAAALAVIGAVFAEWVGSSGGLGYLMLTLNNQGATAEMFAAIAVLSAIGLALYALVAAAEHLAAPWLRD